MAKAEGNINSCPCRGVATFHFCTGRTILCFNASQASILSLTQTSQPEVVTGRISKNSEKQTMQLHAELVNYQARASRKYLSPADFVPSVLFPVGFEIKLCKRVEICSEQFLRLLKCQLLPSKVTVFFKNIACI